MLCFALMGMDVMRRCLRSPIYAKRTAPHPPAWLDGDGAVLGFFGKVARSVIFGPRGVAGCIASLDGYGCAVCRNLKVIAPIISGIVCAIGGVFHAFQVFLGGSVVLFQFVL